MALFVVFAHVLNVGKSKIGFCDVRTTVTPPYKIPVARFRPSSPVLMGIPYPNRAVRPSDSLLARIQTDTALSAKFSSAKIVRGEKEPKLSAVLAKLTHMNTVSQKSARC